MASNKTCVIGAGSSGIAACQVLNARGIPFDCFEKGSEVGGNWRYENDNELSSAYRSLHINTSRGLMAYKTYPMPDDYPDYPNHFQIARYFDDYVDHFGLREKIRFRTEVLSVAPVDGEWEVTVRERDGEQRDPPLPCRAGRQRPPLGPALARAGVSRLGGVRGRADPRPSLPRARGPARQAGAGAGDRQLGNRHRGRGLADRREDLPGDAPRRLRHAQVPERQTDRRSGFEAADPDAAPRAALRAGADAGADRRRHDRLRPAQARPQAARGAPDRLRRAALAARSRRHRGQAQRRPLQPAAARSASSMAARRRSTSSSTAPATRSASPSSTRTWSRPRTTGCRSTAGSSRSSTRGSTSSA